MLPDRHVGRRRLSLRQCFGNSSTRTTWSLHVQFRRLDGRMGWLLPIFLLEQTGPQRDAGNGEINHEACDIEKCRHERRRRARGIKPELSQYKWQCGPCDGSEHYNSDQTETDNEESSSSPSSSSLSSKGQI